LTIHGERSLGGLVLVNATTRSESDVIGPAAATMGLMCDPDPTVSVAATREFLNTCVAQSLPSAEFEFMLRYNLAVPTHVRTHLRGRAAQYESTLSALRLPTLIIHGALDPINRPSMAAYTQSRVQHATSIIYEDAAHMPFWERPERFDRDLAQFIQQIDRQLD
jgi:pimeloyl-ACP methyl ester carboxylesterase